MPIEARNLIQATRILRDQLTQLLATTITVKPLVALPAGDVENRTRISFRDRGRTSSASLSTRFGPIDLFVDIRCAPLAVHRRFVQLQITACQYTIIPARAPEPILRWEFVRFPDENARWCRHHVQGPIPVNLGRATVPLNDLHMPTGWVPIEEIIRFCIVDLGVPALADDWHERLQAGSVASAGDLAG
jgi:hypothetical protein